MRTGWRHFGILVLVALIAPAISLSFAIGQEVTVESNLVYGTAIDYTGSNVSLTLDAYYQNNAQTNRPVIILAHGGGFGAGDKGYTAAQGNFYPDMATAFAQNGFVAFSINYRLWPGCTGGCPEELDMAIDDVMTAVNWIRAHSAHYGINAVKVLIGGDSAGGGLAVNASYQSTNLNSFLGCISLWGGVPPYGSDVHPVNTCPITSQTPPTCMIHGTADTVVPFAVSALLASNLTAAAVYNELHPLAGCNHYPVMTNGVYDTNLVGTIIDYMIAFAKLTTGQAGAIHLGDNELQTMDGQFSFDITGPTDATVAIEQSTDSLSTWQAIATNRLPAGVANFTNPVSAASQFYRARMISP